MAPCLAVRWCRRGGVSLAVALLLGAGAGAGAMTDLGAAPPAAPGPRAAELATKDVFTRGFPFAASFRGEMDRNRFQSTAAAYADAVAGYPIVIKKPIPEELPLGPVIAGFANAVAAKHPRQLFLQHLNSEARAVRPEYLARYFPGHWLYYPGSVVIADLAPESTIVRVANTAEFLYDQRYEPTRLRGQEHSFVLVPLDAAGRRDWYAAEFVTAKKSDIDFAAHTIVVLRAQYATAARSFAGQRAYLAPVVEGVWGQRLFFFNLSTACPRDRAGKTAADVFREEIVEWHGPGGVLSHFDGIAFDVMNWKAKWPGFDVNNDGRADEGIVGGENLWRAGVWDFTRRLRAAMGEDFILAADGGDPERHQRAVGILNGFELEGFGSPRDAWRAFSTSVNSARYWQQFNRTKYAFYNAVGKILSEEDAARGPALYEFVVGAATCLGFSITDYVTEIGGPGGKNRHASPLLVRGADRVPHWLGRPRGEVIHCADRAADVLGGAGVALTDGFVAELKTKNCTVSRQDGELVVLGTSGNPADAMEVSFSLGSPGAGDLTLSFEMRAEAPLSGFAPDEAVPRLIRVHLSGLPRYEEPARSQRFYNDLIGPFGTRGYAPLYFTYRRTDRGEKTSRFTLTIEEQGACRIRRLKVLRATDALVRDFDHGVVLVNPSLAAVALDVTTLPGADRLRRLRLTGQETAPDLQVDPHAVRLEPVTALFLQRGAPASVP